MRDRLKLIWEKQKQLAAHWIPIDDLYKGKLSEEERQKYLIQYSGLLAEENIEMLRCLHLRKFWRKNIKDRPVNWEDFKSELADIMHIVAAIALIAGVSSEEMYKIYSEKNKINFKRLKEGS